MEKACVMAKKAFPKNKTKCDIFRSKVKKTSPKLSRKTNPKLSRRT